MTPQFPYKKDTYIVTQGYDSNPGYYSGHHGGLDIVPLHLGQPFPVPIMPVFSGKTLSVANTDIDRGKGIRVRTKLWDSIIEYLKTQGCLPSTVGDVYIDFLYWHCLQVTDLDGTIDIGTPVGLTGNTGNVYHGGVPVDTSQKGVPPWLGLHLHLECVLTNGTTPYNLDKDYQGRIDPQIIFNYKENNMVLVNDNGTWHLEGELGYQSINRPEYLNMLLRLTNKVETRKPIGVCKGIVETPQDILQIKNV